MKDQRNRNIVRTICFFATLLLGLAAVASAQGFRTCTLAGVAGQWGHTFTGTLILPTGPVPVAAVGTITIDAAGNLSGTQTRSVGGRVFEDTIKGTVAVNDDCTGTITDSIYDQSGSLIITAEWDLAFVDNERELRAILKKLVLQPSGTSVPPVVTLNAKKVFHGVPR